MDLDPRMTFESLVVGPANRLAAAAARRAAESPGRSYNPLFLYSASGLGKSHILMAIAHRSIARVPEASMLLHPLEVYLGELTRALQEGEAEQMIERYADIRLLLLDDVQFLAGQRQAQEMLLRMLDALTSRGGQVVLASDRPPAEIDDLDSRLLSRFSGGLIVDMGQPDLETRVAILRRKAQERGADLAEGVAETLARYPFRNVRELQGALNRVLAVQDLEGTQVSAADLDRIVGMLPGGRRQSDPLDDHQKPEPGWRLELKAAIRGAEQAGFVAQRLNRLLERDEESPDRLSIMRRFEVDIARTREIRDALEELGNPWPEAAATLLRDPDRLEESEALLASARERARPFRTLPEGPDLDALEPWMPPLALRAAERLLEAERPDYNPLFVYDEDGGRSRLFVEAAGRSFLESHPGARVGVASVLEFSEEFIQAISEGVAGAWRERWWTAEVLLLHGLESLSEMDRAQDEFFHLFEALKRRNARVLLAADRPPSEIRGIDERLQSRFEGGLVVELEGEPVPAELASPPSPVAPAAAPAVAAASPEGPSPAAAREPVPEAVPVDDLSALRALAGVGRAGAVAGRTRPAGADGEGDDGADIEATPWRADPERVVLTWPTIEDRIIEEFGG
jgi:chromosomal replication initiator protein